MSAHQPARPATTPTETVTTRRAPTGRAMARTHRGHALRGERGDLSAEFLVYAGCLGLIIVLCTVAARGALTISNLNDATAAAARAASAARTPAAARAAATETLTTTITDSHMSCSNQRVDVDTSGYDAPLGVAAQVRVTVRCTIPLGDMSVSWVPSSITSTATATSPLDRYRQRS